jgi:hypothetical protein
VEGAEEGRAEGAEERRVDFMINGDKSPKPPMITMNASPIIRPFLKSPRWETKGGADRFDELVAEERDNSCLGAVTEAEGASPTVGDGWSLAWLSSVGKDDRPNGRTDSVPVRLGDMPIAIGGVDWLGGVAISVGINDSVSSAGGSDTLGDGVV